MLDDAVPLVWMLTEILADHPEAVEKIESFLGLLADICDPEGIGAKDEEPAQ